jgi:glycosyltransferase involved in cell wall biosynthesis
VKLVVYVDAVYREVDGVVYGEIAFTRFVSALADDARAVTQVGRLDHEPGPAHYPVGDEAGFAGLPHYRTLTQPGAVFTSLLRSLRVFWRALDDADTALLFGPSLHALLFALLVAVRRRRLFLGVRQDFPVYVRSRRPSVRWMHIVADVLELSWRLIARLAPVVVVGEELRSRYERSPRVLAIAVSLISERDIEAGERAAASRSYDGELRLLSVGRLDVEKNPMLLAEVLSLLRGEDPRWRLVVCGEGPLEADLADRLASLGLSDAAELRGYVTLDGGLLDLYRDSHAFLHVSLTEGVPQVLSEAFASGVPVVATAVGGVPAAAGGAAVLIPPADAAIAAEALSRVTRDPPMRERLIEDGFTRARAQTLEREIDAVRSFLRAQTAADGAQSASS